MYGCRSMGTSTPRLTTLWLCFDIVIRETVQRAGFRRLSLSQTHSHLRGGFFLCSSRVHAFDAPLGCGEAGGYPSMPVIEWPSASAATRDTGPSARPSAPTRDHGQSLSCPV